MGPLSSTFTMFFSNRSPIIECSSEPKYSIPHLISTFSYFLKGVWKEQVWHSINNFSKLSRLRWSFPVGLKNAAKLINTRLIPNFLFLFEWILLPLGKVGFEYYFFGALQRNKAFAFSSPFCGRANFRVGWRMILDLLPDERGCGSRTGRGRRLVGGRLWKKL